MPSPGIVRTHSVIDTPIGELTLVGRDGVLAGLYMPDHSHPPNPASLGSRVPVGEGFAEVQAQLGEYFAGSRTSFDLELDPQGSEFQKRVWALLVQIPYGQTRSYGELAEELGDAKLTRAVGAANGRNPISIIVPCHRVVASSGALTGYAGGLERKQFLLDLESPATSAKLF